MAAFHIYSQHFADLVREVDDEQSVSPDSAGVSSMLLMSKKDKTCLVCGDKALGYNFNAVSCESCKAFFRRNAHKTIRGRCEGKCDVNVESRSFCKRCRLQKCFTVGMRKDMILDDEQKLLRKQKIIINRLKRHGTLPPEDTYAVSDADIKQTFSQRFTSQSADALRKQYPNISDEDIQVLRNIKKEKSTDSMDCEFQSKVEKYKPWSDVKDRLEELIQDMAEDDKAIILEMNKAHESSSFLSNTFTRLKNFPSTPTEVFNIADGFVRRIIKVAKQLPFFRAIPKDDQIALLKGSVVEIMMLRSAVNYDVKTQTWNLSTISCIKKEDGQSSSASSPGGPPAGLDINALRKAAMAGADINTLRQMAMGQSSNPKPADVKVECIDVEEHSRMRPDYSDRIPAQSGLPMGNIEHLRNMARSSGIDVEAMRRAASFGGGGEDEHMRPDSSDRVPSQSGLPMANMEHLRNMAKSSGFNVDALRKAAMSGASFEQLSQMARGNMGERDMGSNAGFRANLPPEASSPQPQPQTVTPTSPLSPDQTQQQQPQQPSTSISAEILKMGNPETKNMFLTYSKFIRSLMSTIFGDLVILKFLIMLSLFSPDRHGIQDRRLIETYQEKYALTLQKYIETRFPEEVNMFARCIMKLTDLRNVNEVHTKMLLKMQVEDIEPLLVEIFDLPQ